MELSRKEEYRNQKVSIGVTIFSFIVMLVFFIYTNIITANSPRSNTRMSEVSLALDAGNARENYLTQKAPVASVLVKTNLAEKNDFVFGGETLIQSTTTETDKTVTESHTNDIGLNPIVPINERISATGEVGPRIDFNLTDRTIIAVPDLENDTKEQGTVVVDIVVDKNGVVTEADPNGRGTSTGSTHLKAEAKRVALATKFNRNQKFEEQRGTITIIFSYQ